MSRKLTPFVQAETSHWLDVLADKSSSVPEYRHAMTMLGRQMAADVVKLAPKAATANVCVVCTVEDADFLARGLLEGLQSQGIDDSRLKIVCFWNDRKRQFDHDHSVSFDVAPIIKEYRESFDLSSAVLVVVKSIISGACVVKTNIAALIESALPEAVVVAAPVMFDGAESRLAAEFPQHAAERFRYLTFAIDDEKVGEDYVVPGIGGSVYERLGFTDKNTKNAYVPDLVRSRRKLIAA